jgi:hypothetical protein
MTAEAVINATVTILQSMTTYFVQTADVTIGDDSRLDRGKDYISVLWPGAFRSDETENYQTTKHWDILIDLFIRYGAKGGATTTIDFIKFRDAVISKLDQYPTLNGVVGVTEIVISSEEDPVPVFEKNKGEQAGPAFLMQRLRMVVSQRSAISGGEFH